MSSKKASHPHAHETETNVSRTSAPLYSLRYCIPPHGDIEAHAESLLHYARAHHIAEATLHINTEEWNEGHLRASHEEPWFETLSRVVPLLARGGLRISLNPWSTTLHCSRGRSLKPDQNFTAMVSPTGRSVPVIASFACPIWQEYLARIYALYAELNFDTLWLEDDFRYHNHEPLDWGGDFSAPMLERFSARAGEKVTRQELVRLFLQEGAPHPWRGLLMDVWAETQEEVAAKVTQAVARVAPQTRMGLMSSLPSNHAIEGRRWDKLWRALRTTRPPCHRPNYFPYQEADTLFTASGSLKLDLQKTLRPGDVESLPEVENSCTGLYSKSKRTAWAQMALAQLHGSDGLLLDLHPFITTHPDEDPRVGELLDESRPALRWIGERFPRNCPMKGLQMLWREDVSRHMALPEAAADPSGLLLDVFAASEIITMMGLTTQAQDAPCRILWGRAAWAWSIEKLTAFLRQPLWLDGEAVQILCARGLSKKIGITSVESLDREHSLYSIEQWNDGTREQRATLVHLPCFYRMELPSSFQIWSQVADCHLNPLGPCLASSRSSEGGALLLSAFPMRHARQFPMTAARRTLYQRACITWCGPEMGVSVEDGARMLPLEFHTPERWILAWNLALDPQTPLLHVPKAQRAREGWILEPLKEPRPTEWRENRIGDGLEIQPSEPLPPFGLFAYQVRSNDRPAH